MRSLAVGAHPDDIELGCAGTLLAHRARGDEVSLLVMTTGEQGPQAARSRVREQEDAARVLGATLYWGGFPDGAVPENREAIQAVERVIAESGADLIYAPSPLDTHQDHRATASVTLAAGRRCSRVLTYESPTSQSFDPQLYVDIDAHTEGKLQAIRAHTSQVLKNHLVDLEAVEAMARYRGFQARITHAEAFESQRFVWDLDVAKAQVEATPFVTQAPFQSTSFTLQEVM
jgi:LmbE family N-acetylglucosaminyl deacetylase